MSGPGGIMENSRSKGPWFDFQHWANFKVVVKL